MYGVFFSFCLFFCFSSVLVKCGPLDCQDKSFTGDTSSPSGPLLPCDEDQKDKQVQKDRKEHWEKPKPYRKYSELTPPTVQSCYDNYGFVLFYLILYYYFFFCELT